jgi:NAD(P)-dependent dehydrogenase (short-subunit alcohol dehydrogenase family)
MISTTTIALVTGGARGIGLEVSRRLGERGAVVLAGVRDPERASAALRPLADQDVHPLPLDVTDEASIRAAARTVRDEHGRLDVLVNNAGISLERGRGPSEVDLDTVRRTYETNVFGVVAVTNAFLPLLRLSPNARIVNVSSAIGSLAEWSDPDSPIVRFAPRALAYNSSKTALNAITVAYAHALREQGCKVNAADPGYVSTDLNGHRGYRTAAEGAAIIVRLATLPVEGPTGGFFNDSGPVPW